MKLSGITADTGFLIGLERHKQRAVDLLGYASARNLRISVPVAVVAEWWRGGRRQAQILKLVAAEEMTERLAKSRRGDRCAAGRDRRRRDRDGLGRGSRRRGLHFRF